MRLFRAPLTICDLPCDVILFVACTSVFFTILEMYQSEEKWPAVGKYSEMLSRENVRRGSFLESA